MHLALNPVSTGHLIPGQDKGGRERKLCTILETANKGHDLLVGWGGYLTCVADALFYNDFARRSNKVIKGNQFHPRLLVEQDSLCHGL